MSDSATESPQTVLVTGATGFVGSNLLPTLMRRGYQVVAAVRNAAAAERLRSAWADEQGGSLRTEEVGEIDDSTDWSAALKGVQAVIHLAARAHQLNDTATDPRAEFLRVNTEGTRALATQAVEAGVEHLLFVSSIGAMASLSEQPIDEGTPCRPDTPYGESKLLAEEAVRQATERSATAYTILRPTLVYGPGNPGNMERLEKLIALGLPLPLGGLSNRRSFVYVENLCDGIVACLENPESRGETFVISDNEILSTSELITLIADARNRSVHLFHIPESLLELLGRMGDGATRITGKSMPVTTSVVEKLMGSLPVDNSKIQTCINWHPPFTTEEGIRRTFQQ